MPLSKELFCVRNYNLYLYYLTFSGAVLLSRVLISANSFTPRGVPLSRAALYDPQKDFSCLDGSKLIPFSFVNDDYCDCKDGSDEPGTSACNKGSFFCLNAGHVSAYLRSSKVNDGICDCCDGSDEYQTGTACSNTCNELGRAAREEADRQAKLVREGYQKRLELSKQGKEIRKEKENEKNQLEAERLKAEQAKEEKQKLKEMAETPEKVALDKYAEIEAEKRRLEEEAEQQKGDNDAEDMFRLLDSNGDDKLTIDEIKVRQTFDKNKDGEVSEEEAMFFLNMETEMSKEEFLKTGYLIAKPFFLMEQGMFQPPQPEEPESPTADDEANNQQRGDQPAEHEHEEYEDDEADDMRDPDGHEHHEDDQDDDQGSHESEEVPPPPTLEHEEKYDEATRFLISEADKARTEFNEADRVVRDITNKLQEANDVLNLDFGDDERFAAIWSQCFDFEDREYTYTLCPFKEATQRGKSGGGHVNLGKWSEWSGPETNKYSQMLYDKGQGCWNGPARSARISLTCGLEHKIMSVSEPSRCEYLFEFETPTACEKIDAPHEHDEL